MGLEVPCQRDGLACLLLQTFAMLKQGKITFGRGLGQPCVSKDCRPNKKADMWLLDWKLKTLFSTNITVLSASIVTSPFCGCNRPPSPSHKYSSPLTPHQNTIWASAWISESGINACCLSLCPFVFRLTGSWALLNFKGSPWRFLGSAHSSCQE